MKAQIEGATLYLGDCRELLPDLLDVDCIITDPVWPNCPAEAITGWDRPDDLFREFCDLLPKVRQLVVVLRNDCDPRFLRHVPDWLPFQQVAWLSYVVPGYLGRVLSGNECAYAFGRPVKTGPGRMVIPSLAPKAQPGDRPANGHPMSRALVHQQWLVNWFSDEGETVLDPFMGSGTVGVACRNLGRRFVGVEIERRFFDLSCERIREASRQGDLLRPRPTVQAQDRML